MINTLKGCTEVQKYRHCDSTTVSTYLTVIEHFDHGSLNDVMSMKTRLQKTK